MNYFITVSLEINTFVIVNDSRLKSVSLIYEFSDIPLCFVYIHIYYACSSNLWYIDIRKKFLILFCSNNRTINFNNATCTSGRGTSKQNTAICVSIFSPHILVITTYARANLQPSYYSYRSGVLEQAKVAYIFLLGRYLHTQLCPNFGNSKRVKISRSGPRGFLLIIYITPLFHRIMTFYVKYARSRQIK